MPKCNLRAPQVQPRPREQRSAHCAQDGGCFVRAWHRQGRHARRHACAVPPPPDHTRPPALSVLPVTLSMCNSTRVRMHLCMAARVARLNEAPTPRDELQMDVDDDEHAQGLGSLPPPPPPPPVSELVSRVAVQMWQRRAESRCRCGSGEPSPEADVAAVRPVPVQMWPGVRPVPVQADAPWAERGKAEQTSATSGTAGALRVANGSSVKPAAGLRSESTSVLLPVPFPTVARTAPPPHDTPTMPPAMPAQYTQYPAVLCELIAAADSAAAPSIQLRPKGHKKQVSGIRA